MPEPASLGGGVSASGGCLLWGGCLLRGGLLPGGVCSGGCLLQGGGVCSRGSLLGGCLLRGVSAGGCLLGGCLLQGGYLLPGGVCSGGVCVSALEGVWYPNMHCLLWGVSAQGGSAPGGVCSGGSAPGGCLLPGGVSALEGVCSQGGVCSRGCLLGGVCLLWGDVCSGGVSGIPTCTEADTTPSWTESQTPVKNITLATTSLRPVIIMTTLTCTKKYRIFILHGLQPKCQYDFENYYPQHKRPWGRELIWKKNRFPI